MVRQSKRTSAPTPQEMPPAGAHAVPSPAGAHAVPSPLTMAHLFGSGGWCPPPPPQPMAPASSTSWLTGLQHPPILGPSSQGRLWWTGAGTSSTAFHASPTDNHEDSELQVWGVDTHPPGGFVNFLKKNTQSPAQVVSNGSPSQPISVADDTNDGDCDRTEKRLIWNKEEDQRLVSAWLNNSNDPINSNYKKNDRYFIVA